MDVLRTVHNRYRFVNERDVRAKRYWIVSTQKDAPRAKPRPISRSDYLEDTLDPILRRASMPRRRLVRIEVRGEKLVFVLSSRG